MVSDGMQQMTDAKAKLLAQQKATIEKSAAKHERLINEQFEIINQRDIASNKIEEEIHTHLDNKRKARLETQERLDQVEKVFKAYEETYQWMINIVGEQADKQETIENYEADLNILVARHFKAIIEKRRFKMEDLAKQIKVYKQSKIDEERHKKNHRINLDEATSSTPRREPPNRAAIARRMRTTSPVPEVIDLETMPSPGRTEEEMAAGQQEQGEQTADDSALTETEDEPQQQSQNSSSKRPRSQDENARQNNSCNCSRADH